MPFYSTSKTVTDFEGTVAKTFPSFISIPLNSTGVTESGFSKVLCAFIASAVRIRPVIFFAWKPSNAAFKLGGRFGIQIANRDMDFAGFVLRGGGGNTRNCFRAVLIGTAVNVTGEQFGALVNLIHFKNMIRRGDNHFFAFGQHHRLQDVIYLGDICHPDPVAMLIVYIQKASRDYRVPECILLIQESGVFTFFHVPPCSPFINKKPDTSGFVIFIHYYFGFFKNIIKLKGIFEHFEPAGLIEIDCAALFIPIAAPEDIMVQTNSIHLGLPPCFKTTSSQ